MTTASPPQDQGPGLTDAFGRRIGYLRLSVTDRCNFRCLYCMDPEQRFAARAAVLTLEELHAIARAFVSLGVSKVRLTGGEPLMRRNVTWLMRAVKALPGLDELVITTNGSRLEEMAEEIRAAGVRRINISLDTLKPERFSQITRYGELSAVLAGIDAALAAGFDRVKLNSVILANRNRDEVVGLVRFAVSKGLNISFIEEMPVGRVGGHDRGEAFYSSEQIRADLSPHFTLVPTMENTGGPARYFRVAESETRVGFISPHAHDFCADCNRVRVTTEGRLLLCLGQDDSLDLRAILRSHPGDDAGLREAIRGAMQRKPRGHRFALGVAGPTGHQMNVTGG